MATVKPCTKCGEPPLIDGCCYDCAKLCSVCKKEPSHPDVLVCSKCQRLRETVDGIHIPDTFKVLANIVSSYQWQGHYLDEPINLYRKIVTAMHGQMLPSIEIALIKYWMDHQQEYPFPGPGPHYLQELETNGTEIG